MTWLVKEIEIPINGSQTASRAGISRNSRIVGKRCESHFVIVRNPHHFAGRVLLRRTIATLFRPLVFGRASHRVTVPALLEYQMHVSFVGRSFQKPRAQPVAVAHADFVLSIAGNRTVQREGDAVEQCGFAGSRFTVDEEHVRSGQRREIDGVLPFIWADTAEFQCDEFHCATSLPAFLRTVSMASRSTRSSLSVGVRPSENFTKSRNTSISSVACFRSAIFRLSCDCVRCE